VISSSAVGTALRPEPAPEGAVASSWRRADLARRLQRALALAGRALDAAAAPDDRAADDALPSSIRPLVLAKVVAETGILLRCAALAGADDRALADAVDALAIRLAPLARGEPVLVRLCSEPACAVEHAAAHLYLADIGHRDDAFGRFLQEILAGERAGGAERLPNHVLEHHWLEQIRSGAAAARQVDAALLAATCAGAPLDVLAASTLDLYAFTHAVLYATDMGRRGAPWPRPVEAIAAEAEAALAAALDADNFDLAAELLWTWPMLGLPWSPAANFGFQVLAAAQDDHGFLPGPQYADLAPAQRDAGMLRTSYHANVVLGILCAVALLPGRAPAQAVPAAPADAPSIHGLLRLLAPSPRSPRWLAMQAALAPDRRAALAPFVLSIVLRRAAAAHDIERVRAGLQAALEGDWTDAPAVGQALALLRRVTALARWQATPNEMSGGAAPD
jgi:hypothetical protein